MCKEEETHHWRNFRSWLAFRPWQRHSLVLLIGGLAYVGIGVSFMTLGDEISDRRAITLVLALRMYPIDVWGGFFVASGSLAAISSKWPAFSDSWGYAVLCSISSAWAAIYFLGYIFGPAPMINITYGLVWGLVAFMWWAISGLVNPSKQAVLYAAD